MLQLADGLEQPHRAEAGDLAGVLGRVERDLHVTLRAEVVDLVRIDDAQDAVQRRGVVQIAVVQEQPAVFFVRILIDVSIRCGVERRRAADDAVDLVSLLEQQLGQIRAVLAGDAGDERAFFASYAVDTRDTSRRSAARLRARSSCGRKPTVALELRRRRPSSTARRPAASAAGRASPSCRGTPRARAM